MSKHRKKISVSLSVDCVRAWKRMAGFVWPFSNHLPISECCFSRLQTINFFLSTPYSASPPTCLCTSPQWCYCARSSLARGRRIPNASGIESKRPLAVPINIWPRIRRWCRGRPCGSHLLQGLGLALLRPMWLAHHPISASDRRVALLPFFKSTDPKFIF